MALQTNREISVNDPETPSPQVDDVQVWVTFDDVTLQCWSVRIKNDSLRQYMLRLYMGDNLTVKYEYTSEPGGDFTFNIPAGQRANYMYDSTYSIGIIRL